MYKEWNLIATLSGAYDFEETFAEFQDIAKEIFTQEINETDFLPFQQEREAIEDGFDYFGYLNDKKGYGDDEYIETILKAVKDRTFCLIYDSEADNFKLYEKLKEVTE